MVALGGALGALLRYLVAGFVQERLGGLFPWGTLFVNASGSFLLGFFFERALHSAVSAEWRLFFAVGVLGAYTTFSTYSYETLALLREGALGLAFAYALGTLALGVAAALLGVWLGGR